MVLRKGNAGKAYTGFGRVNVADGKVSLPQTLIGSPAYQAGLDDDDVILTIDGTEIKDLAGINAITDAHKPGDVVSITYLYRGEQKTTKLTCRKSDVGNRFHRKNWRNFNAGHANFQR